MPFGNIIAGMRNSICDYDSEYSDRIISVAIAIVGLLGNLLLSNNKPEIPWIAYFTDFHVEDREELTLVYPHLKLEISVTAQGDIRAGEENQLVSLSQLIDLYLEQLKMFHASYAAKTN